MITTTVGDLLDLLHKYDRNTPVVTNDPNGTGYNRIIITRMMGYPLMVNLDTSIPCDFVDSLSTDLPETFYAIVL
jgi:hypothetical protein